MNEIICLQIIWLFSKGDSGGPIVIDFNKGRLSGFENSCRFMQVGVVSYGDGTSIILQ